MNILGRWWHLGLVVFVIAQTDKCEPPIFKDACKNDCLSMCEDFDCASDASILLGKIYDKDGKFKKNERYAQLPCLNVKVMDYIFLKNKESGVLGDLRNFRDVEILVENLFDRMLCMTAEETISLWEFLPGHEKQARRYPIFVEKVLQAGKLKDLDPSTVLNLVTFAPASSSQLSVIKVLGPDLAKDSAARCALLEASKSIEQAMELKFKPDVEQVAKALGLTSAELQEGCLPCTIPPVAAWLSSVLPGWHPSKLSDNCADTCAAHKGLECVRNDMLAHLDEVDSSMEVLAWLKHFRMKGSKVRCSEGTGNAWWGNNICKFANFSLQTDPCALNVTGAQQLCYCSFTGEPTDTAVTTNVGFTRTTTTGVTTPPRVTKASSTPTSQLSEFVELKFGKQCELGTLVNSSDECQRACDFFGFQKNNNADNMKEFQVGCIVDLRDENCQFNTRKEFSIPHGKVFRRPICRRKKTKAIQAFVFTCEEGKLQSYKHMGDTCSDRTGRIVGCPVGCVPDSSKLCVWEKSGERCVEKFRPSPQEMLPARKRRCSLDGFTTPIMADNVYDCQVKCEQDKTCWTVSWSEQVLHKASGSGRCWQVPGCLFDRLENDDQWSTFFKSNAQIRWVKCHERCFGKEVSGNIASASDCRSKAESKAALGYEFDEKQKKCIIGFTCADTTDKQVGNKIHRYRLTSTEVSYEKGAGQCRRPDGIKMAHNGCWGFMPSASECKVKCNQSPSCFAFEFRLKCCFYGEGVQPMPPVGTGFKCYVLSKNHRTRKRRLDHRRRSLLPAKKSLIGGACTVGRRLYGRAVCTPDNFLQCNKPIVKPKLPICCNGVFHARTFSPSCGAVGKWYLSPVGADCNSVCRDNNLVCTNEALSAHYGDVGTNANLLAVIKQIGAGPKATNCPDMDKITASPDFEEDYRTLYCFTTPGKEATCSASQSRKRRVCYCHSISGDPNPVTGSTTPTEKVSASTSADPQQENDFFEWMRKDLVAIIVIGGLVSLVLLLTVAVSTAMVVKCRAKKIRETDVHRELHQTQSWVDEMLKESWLDKNEIIIDVETDEPGRPWKKIGAGANGQVYSGRFSNTGRRRNKLVALKQSYKAMMAKDDRELVNEVKILIRLSHDNIVQFYGMWQHGRKKFMVMELCPNGDLAAALQDPKHDQKQRCKWMLQIAEAFHFLHTRRPPVVHRDLKPANVLLGHENQAKVADFGLARDANNRDASGNKCGTLAYMPPEALKRRYSAVDRPNEQHEESKLQVKQPRPTLAEHQQRKCAWDTYSFAILMAQVLGNCEPYVGMSYNDIFLAVATQDERMQLKPHIPEQIKQLIRQMWQVDYTQRPMFKEAIVTLRKLLRDFMSFLGSGSRESRGNFTDQMNASNEAAASATAVRPGAQSTPVVSRAPLSKRSGSMVLHISEYVDHDKGSYNSYEEPGLSGSVTGLSGSVSNGSERKEITNSNEAARTAGAQSTPRPSTIILHISDVVDDVGSSTDSYEESDMSDVSDSELIRVNSGMRLLEYGVSEFGLKFI